MTRRFINRSLLLFVVLCYVPLTAKAKEPPSLLGFRIGMTEDAVRNKLRQIGRQQKEEKEREGEEGEQEVWTLNSNQKFDYVVTRFDSRHRVLFVTAVVRSGSAMRYADLASLAEARHATDGRNHTYTWTIPRTEKQPGYLIVARGSHPDFVTSYSLYALKQTN